MNGTTNTATASECASKEQSADGHLAVARKVAQLRQPRVERLPPRRREFAAVGGQVERRILEARVERIRDRREEQIPTEQRLPTAGARPREGRGAGQRGVTA